MKELKEFILEARLVVPNSKVMKNDFEGMSDFDYHKNILKDTTTNFSNNIEKLFENIISYIIFELYKNRIIKKYLTENDVELSSIFSEVTKVTDKYFTKNKIDNGSDPQNLLSTNVIEMIISYFEYIKNK